MAYTTYPQVSTIINGVSQDVRQQLTSAIGTAGQPVLIDYTNRIHKQMLRFSRWGFLKSDPMFFLTSEGQSSYWVGPVGTGPAGTVDTKLNLSDVYQFKKDSIVDLSNQTNLKWLSASPAGPNLIYRDGAGITGLPKVFCQNLNDPNILQIYPPPNNENITQPDPQVPVVTTVAGGALPARTYLLYVTFVDSLSGQSTTTAVGAPLYIPAGYLAVVKSPATGIYGVLPFGANDWGVQYGWYNVYANQAVITDGAIQNEGAETLQSLAPISFGTDWTEPTSGLTTTGAAPPLDNTLATLNSYVIKFEYYKNRIKLVTQDQYLQIPDDYVDIVIAGVTSLVYKLMGKIPEAQMQYQLYKSGMTEMVMDKNLFPEGVEFMRPDTSTYVNTQILGYLDPFFSFILGLIPLTMWASHLLRS